MSVHTPETLADYFMSDASHEDKLAAWVNLQRNEPELLNTVHARLKVLTDGAFDITPFLEPVSNSDWVDYFTSDASLEDKVRKLEGLKETDLALYERMRCGLLNATRVLMGDGEKQLAKFKKFSELKAAEEAHVRAMLGVPESASEFEAQTSDDWIAYFMSDAPEGDKARKLKELEHRNPDLHTTVRNGLIVARQKELAAKYNAPKGEEPDGSMYIQVASIILRGLLTNPGEFKRELMIVDVALSMTDALFAGARERGYKL